MELFGCGTALVTPFRPDGSVDEHALHAHVDWQIQNGVELLIPCGTTGEAATLSDAETQRVIEVTIAAAAGRAPIFAGCTHNSTHTAVQRVSRLSRIPGLTGILTANPYYNRPSQEGQYQHFRAIAESTDLPILLYNIPGRTGANLDPATILRLAEIANVIGVKESSGNLTQITELLTQAPRDFRVFAGDDGLALPVLALGGAGLISVASNVIPAETSDMIRAAIRNDWAGARRINRKIFRLMQALFVEPSPAPVKAVLALLGRSPDHLRLPMVPVTPATRHKLELLIGELGLLTKAPAGYVENLRAF
ncbi:4-hydroxy-tetrahydrodipicolinate synthase [Granulicella tundricola]|uniref:4-hydroxy-tetrahydrodipicolinate synthase n=1 Tax=Granulicella tundricola (strain ATCC BAA-1859 / DSM 23138 / MP5ACTX9) TaxID=1198114 RepID=E8WZP0_GRATM|nr:4-hydroxy-tetrahydrodipicolinate synthase [Granulicella tundricola]ADW70014.1 dihydrodipicolinate synthase [Granulicella tundricola MP5ACTX9]